MTPNEVAKGRVLFKEDKLGYREVAIILMSVTAATFVGMFFIAFWIEDDLSLSLFVGLGFSMMTALFGMQVLVTGNRSFAIYEKGFNSPRMNLKSLSGKAEFITFRDVKSVHPIHFSSFGTSRLVGYAFITTKEQRIGIREIDSRKLERIQKTLESAMKDEWESKYVEGPYLGPKEMRFMKRQLARSKTRVWIEGLGLMGVSFGFFIVSLWLFMGTIYALVIVLGMVGTLLGMTRMMMYYNALANYREAVKHDPSFERTFEVSKDIEHEEDNPLKMILGYTEDDWRRLQTSIKNRTPYYLMFAGVGIIIIGVVMRSAFSLVVLTTIGSCVLISPIFYLPKLERDVKLVKSLVDLEFKDGRRIMPEWFETGSGFTSGIPMRTVPKYSDGQWMKLVWASRIRSEKWMAILMAVFIVTMLMSIALMMTLSRTFHIPSIVFISGLFALMFATMLPVFILAGRKLKLDSIEAFEDRSGERVIPEKYRQYIVKSWKEGQNQQISSMTTTDQE